MCGEGLFLFDPCVQWQKAPSNITGNVLWPFIGRRKHRNRADVTICKWKTL